MLPCPPGSSATRLRLSLHFPLPDEKRLDSHLAEEDPAAQLIIWVLEGGVRSSDFSAGIRCLFSFKTSASFVCLTSCASCVRFIIGLKQGTFSKILEFIGEKNGTKYFQIIKVGKRRYLHWAGGT